MTFSQKKQIKLCLIDFDGVLSRGRFYQSHKYQDMPEIEIVRASLYDNYDQNLMNNWMRGLFTYDTLHQNLSKKLNISKTFLNELLEQSVKEMALNQYVLHFAKQLKTRKIKTIIVTDNMDIFDKVTVTYHKLNEHFDQIKSSSQTGLLKNDEGGAVFDLLIKENNVKPSEVLFIDDSEKTCNMAKIKGLNTFYFNDYEISGKKLMEWFELYFK